ncbi:Substrate-specific component of queuosine-regulated ECF transporter [Salinispira pacifica]|uniref:Substrate-specific component of queuosine-regulated ECF transporter n=1 Tax=Salinispira pacifica TaxID=1307761 RepID=V5WFC2_9SPIO|nr:Substrate-specific component of queuosine-regulated ECF transporter [Salinispira pacifica]
MVKSVIPLKILPAVFIAALLNVLLASLVGKIGIPLYMDSLFSMVVTVSFGLLPGLATAVLTNGILALTSQTLFPFVICHILTVMIAAFMKKRDFLKNVTGFLWLGLFAALINGVVGSVISFYLFSGVTKVHGIDKLVMGLIVTGRSFVTALFWAGMISNILDKVFSALVSYAILQHPLLNKGTRKGNNPLDQIN